MVIFRFFNSFVGIFLSAFLFAGCHGPVLDYGGRVAKAMGLARDKNWQMEIIKTDSYFDLAAFLPQTFSNGKTLVIYIGGDGLSWIGRSKISSNPTPVDPVTLGLALNHSAVSVMDAVYLARPCQFIDLKSQKNCQRKYWTSHRFSHEVIDSTDKAITQIKNRLNKENIILVGYSGGGAVAALVASQRNDVKKIITIAGNMNHKVWARHHKISPLTGSLNPADFSDELKNIHQTHYVGTEDKVVPLTILKAYAAEFPENNNPDIVMIPGVNHNFCWNDIKENLRKTLHFL